MYLGFRLLDVAHDTDPKAFHLFARRYSVGSPHMWRSLGVSVEAFKQRLAATHEHELDEYLRSEEVGDTAGAELLFEGLAEPADLARRRAAALGRRLQHGKRSRGGGDMSSDEERPGGGGDTRAGSDSGEDTAAGAGAGGAPAQAREAETDGEDGAAREMEVSGGRVDAVRVVTRSHPGATWRTLGC